VNIREVRSSAYVRMLCVLNAKVREKSGIKKRETATHATHTAKHASTLASTHRKEASRSVSL